jgi:HAD superfamily hydrolase (TIGR01549 family)
MSIRGVIFDMDGTITAPYLDFARIKAEAGIGDVDMLDYLRGATGAEYERLHKLLTRFEEDGAAAAKLNRGARTLLRHLDQRGIPTALLTRNSRRSVDAVCQKLGVRFDIAVTREEGPHKPAPEPIWRIMERWGLRRDEVLMVGDYKWDVLCARNAGVPCAVLWTGQHARPNATELPVWVAAADYVVHRLLELLPIIGVRSKRKPPRRHVAARGARPAREGNRRNRGSRRR